MTIYFKSCGISTKAFNTLHTLGITMSQKWSYRGIEMLSLHAWQDMARDTTKYPWFGMHNNVNIQFCIYQQCLDNQSHFDSSTAGTVIIINDPACTLPHFTDLKLGLVEGSKSPILYHDILQLDRNHETSQCLDTLAIHTVLKILIDAPEFRFDTYRQKDSPVFACPVSSKQLRASRDSATCQYMLDLLHIEEASYKGNDKVLGKWFQLANVDPTGQQLLVWVRDQLTVARIQGLKKFRAMDLNSFDRLEFIIPIFGWFHAQIAMEHSLHSQYYGTHAGHGLVHTFELLKCKGLHSPSVQGMYHQNIKEALNHIATARFQDLWCTIAQVDNLRDLRDLSPDALQQLATQIVCEYASQRALNQAAGKSNEDRDDVLYQAILWNKDILNYIALNCAISWGDVGIIQDLLL